MTMEPLDRARHLGWFIRERQLIWARREAGQPRPWTDDPILASTHFTNIYRENDDGTKYAHEQLRCGRSPHEAAWFAMAYRAVNRQETFENFGPLFIEDTERWLKYLDDLYDRKASVKTKHHLTPNRAHYVRALDEARRLYADLPWGDPHQLFLALKKPFGIGRFIAWQAHCDLVETGFAAYDPRYVQVLEGSAYAVCVLNGYAKFELYAHRDGERPVSIADRKGRIRSSDANNESLAAWVRWLIDTQDQWLPADAIVAPGGLDGKTMEHALCEWARYGIRAARERVARGTR